MKDSLQFLVLLASTVSASAAPVTFNLWFSDVGDPGGMVVRNDVTSPKVSTYSITSGGLTITLQNPLSDVPTMPTSDVFDFDSRGLGVNGGGQATLNVDETFQFSFDQDVTLLNMKANTMQSVDLDFSTVAEGSLLIATNTNETAFPSSTSIAAGELVTVSVINPGGGNDISRLEYITAQVPEPSAYGLLIGAAGLVLVVTRRRR